MPRGVYNRNKTAPQTKEVFTSTQKDILVRVACTVILTAVNSFEKQPSQERLALLLDVIKETLLDLRSQHE